MTGYRQLAARVAVIFWVSYAGLLLEIAANTWLWHQEGRQGSVTIWLIRSLPLLAFLPWLWAQNPRAFIGVCFMTLLYFLIAVPNAMSPLTVWINYVEVGLVVVLFISSMLCSRWYARSHLDTKTPQD